MELHESFFLGVAGELCAAIDAELLIDVVEMDLDRSLADEEFLADLHIAQPRRATCLIISISLGVADFGLLRCRYWWYSTCR